MKHVIVTTIDANPPGELYDHILIRFEHRERPSGEIEAKDWKNEDHKIHEQSIFHRKDDDWMLAELIPIWFERFLSQAWR